MLFFLLISSALFAGAHDETLCRVKTPITKALSIQKRHQRHTPHLTAVGHTPPRLAQPTLPPIKEPSPPQKVSVGKQKQRITQPEAPSETARTHPTLPTIRVEITHKKASEASKTCTNIPLLPVPHQPSMPSQILTAQQIAQRFVAQCYADFQQHTIQFDHPISHDEFIISLENFRNQRPWDTNAAAIITSFTQYITPQRAPLNSVQFTIARLLHVIAPHIGYSNTHFSYKEALATGFLMDNGAQCNFPEGVTRQHIFSLQTRHRTNQFIMADDDFQRVRHVRENILTSYQNGAPLPHTANMGQQSLRLIISIIASTQSYGFIPFGAEPPHDLFPKGQVVTQHTFIQ